MSRYVKLLSFSTLLLLLFVCNRCSKIDPDWYEDEQYNNKVQPPQEVMDIAGIREGMVIGEIGAGYGRFTLPLAKRVGEKGFVYANDIEESALEFLTRRYKDAGLRNIKPILGESDDPLFPAGLLDMAIASLTYHEIENPVTFLNSLKRSLKPNASVVIVDYDPKINTEESNVGRDWLKEFEDAGYDLRKTERLKDRDIIFILKVKTNN